MLFVRTSSRAPFLSPFLKRSSQVNAVTHQPHCTLCSNVSKLVPVACGSSKSRSGYSSTSFCGQNGFFTLGKMGVAPAAKLGHQMSGQATRRPWVLFCNCPRHLRVCTPERCSCSRHMQSRKHMAQNTTGQTPLLSHLPPSPESNCRSAISCPSTVGVFHGGRRNVRCRTCFNSSSPLLSMPCRRMRRPREGDRHACLLLRSPWTSMLSGGNLRICIVSQQLGSAFLVQFCWQWTMRLWQTGESSQGCVQTVR